MTFKDDFPGMVRSFALGEIKDGRDNEYIMLKSQTLRKYCLDKQRVKQVILKHTKRNCFNGVYYITCSPRTILKELGLDKE